MVEVQEAVPNVILRFFELHLEAIFLEKKDLGLHFIVEVEVLLFGNWDVPLSCEHFWDSSLRMSQNDAILL